MGGAGTDLAWIEQAPCGYLQTRANGSVLLANALFAGWAGRPAEALVGLHFSALLTPASRIFYQTHCLPMLRLQGFANEIAFDLLAPDGSRQPVLVNVNLRHGVVAAGEGDDGTRVAITVFGATETRRHEKALREARRASDEAAEALAATNAQLARETERLRVTLYSIGDAVVTTDAAGRIETMNGAAQALTGVAEAAARGAPIASICRTFLPERQEPRDCPVSRCLAVSHSVRSVVDCRLERADGDSRWIVDTASPIVAADGAVIGAVWVARDTTEQRAVAARMAFEESHDPLTGLYNRREFERRITALAPGRDGAGGGSLRMVCVIDLDQFKLVNDTVGNAIGDALLVQVAQRLDGLVRQSDVLARLGGDEFGLLLEGCSIERAEHIGQALCARIRESRFRVGEHHHALRISIGIAPIPADGASDTALAQANIACDAAKEAGRDRVVCFQAGDAALSARRGQMGWVARIRDAIDCNRFELFFQPIVPTGAALDGAPPPVPRGELLLRMRDEHDRLLAPGAFLPAAERYGQMQAIDRWVLHAALAWMAETPEVCCSINVSGQSLGDPDFRLFAIRVLDAAPVSAGRVCIEITETVAISDLEAALGFIAALRARGVRFALDDFGCGMSSFSYLKTLSVDYLKIDGSFVKDIQHNPLNRAIVESIHRVARVSGLQTVAEWVENDEVLQAVAAIGIDFAQGYGTGKPFPISEWPAHRARPCPAAAARC